jgi:polyphosphate glucokinase
MDVLGIDFGGSGIKGALVNVSTGEMVTQRHRLPTPEGARPGDVAEVIKELAAFFNYKGPIGVGFPSVVLNGTIHSAANISAEWIGMNAAELFKEFTKSQVFVLNDADAAGMAEMRFGAGREYANGVVLMLTLGTGIGSAIFVDGHLFPNTEFGHIEIRGKDAERRASDAARQRKELTWEQWGERLQEYLSRMEALMWPDVVVLGGGVSKEYDKFLPFLKIRAKVIPAMLLNQAGIVGAAVYAAEKSSDEH